MNDIAMVLLTLGFFGLAWRYVRVLERLWGRNGEPGIRRRPGLVGAAARVPLLRAAQARAVL